MRNAAARLSRILTPSRMAVLFGILFALSILPILYVAPAVRATGDDLGYSYTVKYALQNGEGICGIASAIAAMIAEKWNTWQGTWSSIALFCLQPGIWGDSWYPLTVLIALVSILTGLWYCLFVILKSLGFRASFCWIAFFLTALLVIQYMPYERGGLFWWTSVAHYSIPFGAVMLCIGFSLRWLETGKIRFYVPLLLLMTYLGGAGYPELVLGAAWIFLVIAGGLTGIIKAGSAKRKTRSLLLLIPLALLLTGFVISAMAPGNTVRGGEGFGFHISDVMRTLRTCVAEGFAESVGYFLSVRVLLPVLLVIAVFAWEMTDTAAATETALDPSLWWQPVLIVLVGFGLICIVRAPAIYAGTEVSGGVPDSYWFITMTAMTLCSAALSSWFRLWFDRRRGRASSSCLCWSGSAALIFLLFCLLFFRHLVGDTVDYTCMQFAASGQLADYEEQMGEWLAILNDPSVEQAQLPAMNDEQGPFMLMVPTGDSSDYTSWVYALYYGKESVVMVPREESE